MFDVGDTILDSLVVLDDFEWIESTTTVGTAPAN